jgi:hypothetical protein
VSLIREIKLSSERAGKKDSFYGRFGIAGWSVTYGLIRAAGSHFAQCLRTGEFCDLSRRY